MATYDVNANNDELAALAATSASAAPEKKKANVLYRLLALILAACPIVLFCLFPVANFVADGTLLNVYMEVFSDFFGYIQAVMDIFAAGDVFFGLALVAFTLMPVLLAISAILALVALFSGKAAPGCARAITWINFWAVGGYMLSYATLNYFADGTFVALFAEQECWLPFAVAGGMAFFGFIFSAINSPKKVWFSTILFIFALAFNVVTIYVFKHFEESFANISANEAAWLAPVLTYGQYALLGLSALCLLITSGMLAKKKGFGGNLFVAIVHLILTGALLALYLFFWNAGYFPQRLVLGETTIAFSGFVACLIAFGAISVLELIISIVRLCVKAKKVEEVAPVVEETASVAPATPAAPVDLNDFYGEEEEAVAEEEDYVEATPYQPVATEEVAEEEVEETVEDEVAEEEVEEEEAPIAAAAPAPAPAPVAPAANDNTKIDDEFIATLTAEERKQFADIFFLKSKGDFPGVPDYKKGEDNSAFFRKIFVYLGKYRSRIPDDLMGKIYDFAVNK